MDVSDQWDANFDIVLVNYRTQVVHLAPLLHAGLQDALAVCC